MESKPPKKSDVVDSIRNMVISRREGVRTRGGRFPAISMREISQVTGGGSKKIVVPNIPQRRRIKQEIETPTVIKSEPKDGSKEQGYNSKTTTSHRGRGRGKVIIQTAGTFLADGPAARVKRDPLGYERFSYDRSSRTSAASEICGATFDDEAVKDLLESPYLESEVFEDFYRGKPPHCLGIPKKRVNPIKKAEPDVGIKKGKDDDVIKKGKDDVVIKKEKDDGIKKEKDDVVIKKEKDDGIKETIKIKKEICTEIEDDEFRYSEKEVSPKRGIDSKTEVKSSAEQFQNLKGREEMMILLQIPAHSSIPKVETSEGNSQDKSKENEIEIEQVSTFVDRLEEGFIGKLQIMKSGRMKIVLGSVEFDVIDGSSLESYWEAVSIRMLDEGGDIAVLGKIEKKMILTPVMDILLKKNQDIKQDMD